MKSFLLRIHKKVVKGHVYWCIVVPADLTASKRRAWEYFASRQEALARAAQLNRALVSRRRAAVLSEAEQVDAVRALELLRDLGLEGVSLRQAVEAAVAGGALQRGRMALGVLLEEFRRFKHAGWRELSRRNFDNASRALLERFEAGGPADLRPAELEVWLAERFKTPGNRAFAMRTLKPAFNWAVRQGLITVSPFDRIESPKVRRGAVQVLAVEEARHALEVCPHDCLAAVALMMFGGIRPQEVARLTWDCVMEDIVHLTPEVTKTAQVRNVVINETLAAWLAGCRRVPGALVVPDGWRWTYRKWRAAAGISEHRDVLRHTFATYHLRMWNDEAALRRDMGHSRQSEVLFAHYLAAATPEQARAFWALRPECS